MQLPLQSYRGPNLHDDLQNKSGFEQFIILFRKQFIAEKIIDNLYDLNSLRSLHLISSNLALIGELNWNIEFVMRKLDQKISNSLMTTWMVINSHFVPYGYFQPCHLCSELGGWGDVHVSLHLGPEDMGPTGPRDSYVDRYSCPHCIGHAIHYPQHFQLTGFHQQ